MTQPLQTRRFNEALARVQHLFVQTPGVELTTADAAQMAGLDRQVCRVLLRNLVDAGFLEPRLGGMFVRSSRSPSPISSQLRSRKTTARRWDVRKEPVTR